MERADAARAASRSRPADPGESGRRGGSSSGSRRMWSSRSRAGNLPGRPAPSDLQRSGNGAYARAQREQPGPHLQAELETVAELAPAIAAPSSRRRWRWRRAWATAAWARSSRACTTARASCPAASRTRSSSRPSPRRAAAGSPLDHALAQQFGSALGRSVSDVRVHTDDTAASLTRAVSARAFATGRDIFFAPGEYQPHSPDGPRADRPRGHARRPAARRADERPARRLEPR